MGNIKEIFQEIRIIYKGIELTKLSVLNEYASFLCEILDSDERHTAAIALHTGDEYYQAMAVTVASFACLFHNNTDIEELISNLTVGDMLIVDGQRVRYQGIKDGSQLGIGFCKGIQYFALECNNSKKWTPLSSAKRMNISLYQGGSETLGGQGIKRTFKERKAFLSAFIKTKAKAEISTEINNSIAIVLDRDIAEEIYQNITILHEERKFRFEDLVTAAYYSENEEYQIGANPTKEEPILKFYSKISVCREDIMEDRQKRIMGCLLGDETLWNGNSEIFDITDRKSLKFVLLLGKSHYVKYQEWFQKEGYRYYVAVPESVFSHIQEGKTIRQVQFYEKLADFANRTIETENIDVDTNTDIVFQIKSRLLRIKKESIYKDEAEDFVITSFFLLNLCRSAFFPLLYCGKAYKVMDLEEKLSVLEKLSSVENGSIKEDVLFVAANIGKMIERLYSQNPKGEYIKEQIIKRKVDCLVSTKGYYGELFSLWLKDCKTTAKKPNVITVSAFEKSEECFHNVIFTTAYYDFSFNPYASFGFSCAQILTYDYERYQAKSLSRCAEQGRRLIREKNELSYFVEEIKEEPGVVSSDYEEDILFESEMDKMAEELQLKSAYRYLSNTQTGVDTMINIAKIFTFASGNTGFFTKHFKGYRINGTEVSEEKLEDLKVGDSIIFTKESENKDIVDLLLKQLLDNKLKNTHYPECYCLSVLWKDRLCDYKYSENLTYQELAARLKIAGCERHQATLMTWLDKDSHIVGPRAESDYVGIVKLLGLEVGATEICKACNEIRSLRTRILNLLGKAILKGMFSDKKDELWDIIADKADSLSQIEQITSIHELEEGSQVPMYMINKPCEI